MRDGIRHIGQWLSALMMVLLLSACPSSSENDEPEEPKKKPVLKVYVFAPDRPIVTRADIGDVDATAEENKIYRLQVWVFEHSNGNFVGYISLNNVDLSEAGSEVSIDITDDFASRKPSVDVYAAANLSAKNTNLVFDNKTTRATLDGALIQSGYFGVSPLVSIVPADGLPMSGVIKDVPIDDSSSPVFRVGTGGLSNVKLVRAVSKIRFVFCKSSANEDALTINSVKLNADVLPNEEYLFLAGPYPTYKSNVNTPGGYVVESELISSIDGANVKSNNSPASYGYKEGMTGQQYETLINTGIAEEKLSEVGRFYFRESDKQMAGTINYKIGDNDATTANFQTAALPAQDFTRNHSWIVYGYFVSSGNLVLNMVEIKDWGVNITEEEVYNW